MKSLFYLLVVLTLCCLGWVLYWMSSDPSPEDLKELTSPKIQELETVLRFEGGACPRDVSADIVELGDFLVFGLNEKFLACESLRDQDSPSNYLYAYHIPKGELTTIDKTGPIEGTPIYVEEEGLLLVPLLNRKAYALYDSETFELIKMGDWGAAVDTTPLYLNGYFYLGTVNTPFPQCQSPLNAACGSVFKLNKAGELVDQFTFKDGFHAWVTTALSTDGEFIYLGTGESNQENTYYECSVIKFDQDLNLLASYDPAQEGCGSNGPRLENAVGGKVVLSPDGSLWVQWLASNDEQAENLVHLDSNLNPICELTLGSKGPSSNYYKHPVVDSEGFAYAVMHSFDPKEDPSVLYKISPSCELVWQKPLSTHVLASPVLHQDELWLSGEAQLLTYSMNGDLINSIEFDELEGNLRTAFFSRGKVWLLSENWDFFNHAL